MTEATIDDRTGTSPASTQPDLGWSVAILTGAAAIVHFAMVPAHAGSGIGEPLAFAAAAWFQAIVATLILTGRGSRQVLAVTAAGNAVILGAWIWSRTSGLPWGGHAGEAEAVTLVDGITAGFEAVAIVLALRLLLTPRPLRRGYLVPALTAVAAVTLTTVAVTAPDAASHSHDDTEAAHAHDGDAPDGQIEADVPHGHDAEIAVVPHDDDVPHADDEEVVLSAHEAEMARIDAERCDTEFNHSSYWAEAEAFGIDTYDGGHMFAGSATADAGGHGHGAPSASGGAMTIPAVADPLGGRGSAQLDALIASTKAAATGERAAQRFIVDLAGVSDETYAAWQWWMRTYGEVGHPHDPSVPDEGHGGHAGPHTWTALTDPVQCQTLADELALARTVALALPTAQDAMDAGYFQVTRYGPGIGAHYMHFGYLDGVFEIGKPEMLLYDGNGPEASIVGLSYMIQASPDAEPTQGFTGSNDTSHRHVGLCIAGTMVVGDSTTTPEECAALGGVKSEGGAGWMNHVWVIPGCESPWGVFSAANPVLDGTLGERSGTDGGGCAGSSVRARYGLDAASLASVAGDTTRATTDPNG